MPRSSFFFILFFFFPCLDAQTTPVNGIREQTPSLVALTRAKIVINPETILENATLLLQSGKILEIGTTVSIPTGTTQIDLTGYTIYPGFIDPYTQYGIEKMGSNKSSDWRSPPKYEGTRKGGNAWNDAIHSEIDWYTSFTPDLAESKEFLSQGILVVQSGKMDGIFRGRAFVTLLDQGLPNDLILRPTTSQWVSFNKGSSSQNYPNSLMGSIALIRQTFLDTEWYRKAEVAYQLNPQQPRPEFNASLKALQSVLPETGVPIPSYLQDSLLWECQNIWDILRAQRIAQEFGLRPIYLGNNDEYTRIEALQAIQTTLILPVNYPPPPSVETKDNALDITLAQLRHFERAPLNPSVLERQQIRFAFTSHTLKKKTDFLKNIRKAVRSGLSSKVALAALTVVPAEICGVSSSLGTLTPGKIANFFVCNGDIFDEKTLLYSVWIQGKEQSLQPFPKTDFRGKYRISLVEHLYDLELRGEILTLQAKLVPVQAESPKPTSIEILSSKDGKLQGLFTLEIPNSVSGVFRFTGRKQQDQLILEILLPSGESLLLTIRQETLEETKAPEKPVESAQAILSRLTYPNRAFGFETLPKTEDVLIQNATVWTSEKEGILEKTDVLIQNGKFTNLGKSLTPPEGIKILDATGKHLTAGIIDEHSHIAIAQGVNESGQAITAEVRIGDVVHPEDINIYRALAGGVTAVQLLHGSANPIGGQAQVIKLRWGSLPEAMKVQGIPASIKFALGENVKQSNWGEQFKIRYPQTRMGVESLILDTFRFAQQYQKEWQHYLSLAPEIRRQTIPPRKDLELEALSEILQSKMLIHCHSYVQSEILMLMRLAESFGFKIQTFTHILEGYKVASEMAKHGASASSFSDWWAYKFEVYDAIPFNATLMTEKGVLTSINSDSPEMGRRLNQEAAKAVTYGGMSLEEAWKMVTINPAIQLKMDAFTGSIRVGKEADFVLWSASPLSIYARVEQTWIDGKKYFDRDFDQLMRKTQQQEKTLLLQKILKMKQETKSEGEKNAPKQDKIWHCEDIEDVWKSSLTD